MSGTFRPLQSTDLLADSVAYLNGSDEALQTDFSGDTEPSASITKARMTWKDTLNGLVKQRNANNDGWIIVGLLDTVNMGMLPLTGGTMSGDINMGGNIISNVGEGEGDSAATVDSVNLKADLDSPTFTGDPSFASDPAGDDSLTRKKYITDNFLQLTGGTLTGTLGLTNGTAASHALRKDQIEALKTFDNTTGHNHDGTNSTKIQGTSLRATGVTLEGSPLIANGSGSAVWGTMGDTFTTSVQLLTDAAPAGWFTLDVGPNVPDAARWVVLKVKFDNGIRLHLRVNSTYSDNTYGYLTSESAPDLGLQVLQMITPVDDPTNPQEFDYRVNGAGGVVNMWLVGWL